jgi:hypothetical protein
MTKVYDNATDIITFARLQAQNTTSGSSYLGSDGLLKFAAEDEPRIEYAADGSLKGLLIEEQRTNLVTHSEDFTHSSWKTTNVTITPDQAIAPNGTQTAALLQINGAAGNNQSLYRELTLNATVTYSIWVKAVQPQDIGTTIRLDSTGGGAAGKAVTLTSEWQRVSISPSPTGYAQYRLISSPGTATQLYLWGAQLEEGSFPTSYIPTSGSTVTRSPDLASIPVSAFGYNQEAGTVVVEASPLSDTNSTAVALASSTDNSGLQERWHIRSQSTDTVRVLTAIPGNDPFSTLGSVVDVTGITIPGTYKAAHTLEENYSQVAVNGSLSTADTSVSFPDVNELRIGALSSDATTAVLNGHIKSIQYYPRRLTDAQLQELTA